MTRFVALVLGLAAAGSAVAAPGVVKRDLILSKQHHGTCVTTTRPDGTIEVVYDVLENGRGPHFETTLTLAPDGTIASLSAKGHHTFGAQLKETFTVEGKRATWKSDEESGERQLDKPTFFVPASDVPESIGLLVRAALRNGGTIALLPGGEARVEKLAEATVHAGDKTRKLVDYGITGIDLIRDHVWMNDDGTFFGYVGDSYSLVPEGWDGVAEELNQQQKALDRAHDAELARTLTHLPPAAGLAYTHARVLDVARGAWLADQTVVVVGEKISAVGPSAKVKPPAGAEVIDLGGKAILPGLWDMHAHLGDSDGLLNIASGVTTVRDVGNVPDRLDDYKARFDAGKAIGPHVYRMGFIEGRNPKASSSEVTAETEAEAKAGVEYFAKRHYDGMKIYNSVRPELVPIIAREAHARGMSVTGHIPVHMLANEAVKAGYDGIEHINMLFLNFFATHETDTRDTTRFTLVGDNAASFDLDGAPMRDFLALLKSHHTVIDPTVGAFEDLLVGEQGKFIPMLAPTLSRLPVQTQRYYRAGGLPLGDKKQRYHDSYEKLLALVKKLVDSNITVVAGTDALAGLFLDHELALFVRAGLTPAEALRAATLIPARVMHAEATSGTIAAGKTADLVVVDGDPLARIDDVGRVVATVRGGRVFASPALFRLLGVEPLVK